MHSRRALAIQRSQIAFARGARTGVVMTRMPAAVKTASNAPVYLASRSLIRNFKPVPCQNSHTGSELVFSGLVTLPSSTR